jgi:hypothetical protein
VGVGVGGAVGRVVGGVFGSGLVVVERMRPSSWRRAGLLEGEVVVVYWGVGFDIGMLRRRQGR